MAVKMKKLNLNGLTKRWVVNVLSVVFAVLLIFTVMVSVALHEYYDRAVERYITGQLNTAISMFSGYSSAGTDAFASGAKEYVESFTQHDTMEVQFLTGEGNLIVSTTGFLSDSYENSADYKDALKSPDRTALWQGKTAEGEQVMTAAGAIVSKDNPSVCVGIIRLVVSLEGINRQYNVIFTAVVTVVLLFFLMIVLSGSYFVRSIIAPIQGLSQQATKIAHGDFETRIAVDGKRKDEITTLCETINRMAKELSSTEQMKNEFISSVSHELRTPLTAIKGWGETVVGSMDDPKLVKKGIEVIIGEAERLSVIVEDLLDFSRMQNGKLTYHMAPCDVVAEMGEAILSLTANAAEQKVNLDFAEPKDIPIITGDAGRLQQVFVNVLGNALKYTPEGGSIVVDMKPHRDEIEILISDTGRGIDPEDLDHIKQKFYKGKDAARGSGIGLAIADEIVTAHGGRLEIASTLRVGTTVTIFLPVKMNDLVKENEHEQ